MTNREAAESGQDDGVFGGTTPAERKVLRTRPTADPAEGAAQLPKEPSSLASVSCP